MKNNLHSSRSSIKYPESSIQQQETRLKGILFDFDGVVLDSMKQHVTAWQYAFRKEGVQLSDLEIYLLEGRGVEALVNAICDNHKLPKEIIPRIMEKKIKYYDQHIVVNFYDGFFDLLEFLKSKKLKMVIVTGGSRDRIISFEDQYIKGYFSGLVCADDVVNTKPFPEPYIKGLEMLKLKAGQCIVIENAPLGIQSAKAANIKTIAIETTLDKSYLQQADIIVTSFTEVLSAIDEMLE